MSIIEVSHLTKYYGKSRGIVDVSFNVEEGEIFGFIGPNGAGKSTTMKILACLLRPDSGSAKIAGFSIQTDGDKIRLGSTTILKFTYHDKLEESFQQQMYDAALRDGLTKAFNKKYFLDRLDTEYAYARRHNSMLSLVMFDVDFFKKVNDNYGHLAGDYVLQKLAKLAQSCIRTEDVFARYGGEEFALISRGLDSKAAHQFAERVRSAVERFAFTFQGQRMPVTVSVGISAMPESQALTAEALVDAADKALYAAKSGGRNRVCVHTP